jgi:hypothetical protein
VLAQFLALLIHLLFGQNLKNASRMLNLNLMKNLKKKISKDLCCTGDA